MDVLRFEDKFGQNGLKHDINIINSRTQLIIQARLNLDQIIASSEG